MKIKTQGEINNETCRLFEEKDPKSPKYQNRMKKRWVAVDDVIKEIIKMEGKRITNNNDYISIPMKDYLLFKEALSNTTDSAES